jgi:hypothetical protein
MSPVNAAAKRDARKMSQECCRNGSHGTGIGSDLCCGRVVGGSPDGIFDGLRSGADCAPMADRPECGGILFCRWPIASKRGRRGRRHAEARTSRVGTSRSTRRRPGTPAGRWIDRTDEQCARRASDVRGPSSLASHTTGVDSPGFGRAPHASPRLCNTRAENRLYLTNQYVVGKWQRIVLRQPT